METPPFLWRGFNKVEGSVKRTRITCASRIVEANCDSVCAALKYPDRCVDVPLNECRMKPIDAETGKKLKRKFTVKKEGVKAKWW